MPPSRSITIFAPAKVNLYLHITGRRTDGYHELESLVTFADIGDRIQIDPAPVFSFSIDGPFSESFISAEKDPGPQSRNLAVRAVWALAERTAQIPRFRLTLTKNLPFGAGLGGGSSDAAAVLWGLMDLWDISSRAPFLPDLMRSLGADVSVCLAARPTIMRGIGEHLMPAPELPELPVVLACPGVPSNTAQVYQTFRDSRSPFRPSLLLPDSFENISSFIGFLKTQTGNDLAAPACTQVPQTARLLRAMEERASCLLARITGSGSSCFGLFAHEDAATAAALDLAKAFPEAWVRAGWLGRTERY